jgi:hypothetical protein
MALKHGTFWPPFYPFNVVNKQTHGRCRQKPPPWQNQEEIYLEVNAVYIHLMCLWSLWPHNDAYSAHANMVKGKNK